MLFMFVIGIRWKNAEKIEGLNIVTCATTLVLNIYEILQMMSANG